ncbi:MAG: N-acetyltransferase [Chloroflexota bacterium]|nr:MAG: N-acetyltransferase [Chloroflexota bacterium]
MIEKEKILGLIGKIYPEARVFVGAAYNTPALKVCRYFPSKKNEGAFCLVEGSGFLAGYLAFRQDLRVPSVAAAIQAEIIPYYPTGDSPEFCMNVYGRNPRAIRFIQELGFHLDMHGFKLKYSRHHPPGSHPINLNEKSYHDADLAHYTRLFDRGYEEISRANGWPVGWYSRCPDAFGHRLRRLHNQGGVRSFWRDGTLVAAYLIQGIYISDLVVDPDHQNRGLGSAILARCIHEMLVEKKLPEVRLSVAQSNSRALRFYQRHHFVEIGSFADHTWSGS